MDEEEKPSGLIPSLINEVSEGVSEVVPILQKNMGGALMLALLLLTTTFSAAMIVSIWQNPIDFGNKHEIEP